MMRRSMIALLGATALTAGALLGQAALAQTPATPGAPDARHADGVNVGQLDCHVAGGIGFIFGSSKDLECLLVRTDGLAEPYHGDVKKLGVDIGFTKEAHIIWLVFAPGAISKGALAGEYAGVTASATVGVGAGANVLVGGSNKQITLQPVSVEGSVGLNVAAGIGAVTLRPGH
jgi:prepilin-type processing-associated H-X9-DG protein